MLNPAMPPVPAGIIFTLQYESREVSAIFSSEASDRYNNPAILSEERALFLNKECKYNCPEAWGSIGRYIL
ncbi:hypothetical cytosolic protein [Syntrophus aciditrophicus SB]|uniref:Hypothetical cytosolic protein n=1 Tax=Syntrophus aciditrophicus (strain SB) TaxID=56780 RepID=Q2LSK5_SYNAS|nr:hypothetical cytosolic protein [Syntrophus aciditrophicus SB]